MSSQLEDHFNAAVEAVARLLYARKRTPREPKWGETDPEVRRCCVRDARAVIDLWLKVSAPCLWCAGTGRTADGYPCSGWEALDTPGTTAARIVEENPYRSYDQIAADTRTAEIVEMLRAEFQRFSEDSQATDYDLAMRDGWLYAADLIVSRFGGGES